MKIRKEIGSEFHMDVSHINDRNTKCNVFDYLQDYNSSFFDSGRSALRMLLKKKTYKRVLLPNYLCGCVRDCFSESEIVYYRVNEDFQIDWEDLVKNCQKNIDLLYLHFFNGYIGKQYDFNELAIVKEKYGFEIVEDTTHSFLSNKNIIGDYCICSLRKWFPVADGGVLYTHNALEQEERPNGAWVEDKKSAMILKGRYLRGEDVEKKEYLRAFENAEGVLDNQIDFFQMSTESIDRLRKIEVDDVRKSRSGNYMYLFNQLSSMGYDIVATDGDNQVPIFCVLKTHKRDRLREFLIKSQVYCPVHWPLYDELLQFPESVNNQRMELSIPIDQRYTIEDMERVVRRMEEFLCSDEGKM